MDDFLNFVNGGSQSSKKPQYSVEDVQNMVYGQESNFGKLDTTKPNYAGAIGPGQILTKTWEGAKKRGLIPAEYDINNPKHNLEGSKALIADSYNRYGGDADKVLAEYYAGPDVIKNGEIQTNWKDLKNDKAPTVGQYIDQAKSKLQGMGDDFSNFIMAGSTTKTEKKPEQEIKQSTQQQPLQPQSTKKETSSELLPGIASVADTTIGAIPAFVGKQVSYAVGRALQQSPKEAEETSNAIASLVDKPFGKAFGVTENASYKNEASQRLMNYISENVSKGAQWLAEKTGIPAQDIESYANSLGLAVGPKVGKVVKNEVSMAKSSIENQFANKKNIAQKGAVKTAVEGQEPLPVSTPEYVADKGTAKPYAPEKDFQELKYDEKGLPLDEQQARLEVLNRTSPLLKVDPNVIEGRGKDRATDYQVSKTDTPEGNLLAEKLKEEKLAKTAYGERLINESGGTYGLDESANYRRGNNTIGYFQKLETYFDDAIKKIYGDRDVVAGSIPVNGQNIKTALTNEVTLELGDNAKLAKAANAKLKQLGMMDKDGVMLPSNGFKAEKFRQWLNEDGVWDRSNAVLHRELKNAVDQDVVSTLDPNTSVYADARTLFGLKKDTLENPNGISRILEAEGPKGINRKVDIEKIPNSIAGLGVDQLTHIIDTIDNAPALLKKEAEIARSEIKAQFLNRAHEAFEKNANAGTKYLKDNKEVMGRLFTPEEMAKIDDYNSLSHILKTETGYPGAKAQEINLEKRLPQQMKEQFMKKGAALATGLVTGGQTLGIAESIVHGAVEKRIAKKDLAKENELRKESFEKKQKGFTNLKDIGKK